MERKGHLQSTVAASRLASAAWKKEAVGREVPDDAQVCLEAAGVAEDIVEEKWWVG